MLLRTKLHGKTYEFPDLRLLIGKANEEKSGDRLAGVAAETTAERVAARFVLAEMPLWVLRQHPAIPYEQDEVTRVIQEAVHEPAYQEIKDWTVGQLREWLLADTTTGAMIHHIATGLTAEMIAAVTKLMSNLDLIYGAKKIPRTAHCANTIGAPGTLSSRNQPNHPTDSLAGIRAAIYEGLAYGSGDSVIGINPVDSWKLDFLLTSTSLPFLLRMLQRAASETSPPVCPTKRVTSITTWYSGTKLFHGKMTTRSVASNSDRFSARTRVKPSCKGSAHCAE